MRAVTATTVILPLYVFNSRLPPQPQLPSQPLRSRVSGVENRGKVSRFCVVSISFPPVDVGKSWKSFSLLAAFPSSGIPPPVTPCPPLCEPQACTGGLLLPHVSSPVCALKIREPMA